MERIVDEIAIFLSVSWVSLSTTRVRSVNSGNPSPCGRASRSQTGKYFWWDPFHSWDRVSFSASRRMVLWRSPHRIACSVVPRRPCSRCARSRWGDWGFSSKRSLHNNSLTSQPWRVDVHFLVCNYELLMRCNIIVILLWFSNVQGRGDVGNMWVVSQKAQ